MYPSWLKPFWLHLPLRIMRAVTQWAVQSRTLLRVWLLSVLILEHVPWILLLSRVPSLSRSLSDDQSEAHRLWSQSSKCQQTLQFANMVPKEPKSAAFVVVREVRVKNPEGPFILQQLRSGLRTEHRHGRRRRGVQPLERVQGRRAIQTTSMSVTGRSGSRKEFCCVRPSPPWMSRQIDFR